MAETRVQRRLAAILAADVAGYSRLVEADEEGTVARLKSLQAELIHPMIANDGGRLVKVMGDGVLVEFGSAVDAVRNALAIQSAMKSRNADLQEADRIEFRVGINVGDVIIDGDDIQGDGVNIAARLEGLCEVGQVFVSRAVRDQVEGKLAADFDDLGEQKVKNMARSVRVYRARAQEDVAAAPSRRDETLPLPGKPSIAVLPFQNMSGDIEQEYFADGMAEDIITALSRFRWFFVIARNSSFTYKGKAVDVRTVGRELGVRYVLEGSVRKGGDRLRITAQLIEAATGNHIWADRFDGELAEVFDLQDRITEAVVGAIEPSVRHAEIERARAKRPDSLDAYDLYLRALPHVWANTGLEHAKATAFLDQALEIDPNYAAAHGLSAVCHWIRYSQEGLEPDERMTAIGHARAVLDNDADDPNALAFAGIVISALENDLATALGAVDKAVALNPNSSRAHTNRAMVLISAGRDDEAIRSINSAIRLSPFDPMRYGPESCLSIVHFLNGRYGEAIEAAQRALQSSPHMGHIHALLAASQYRAGLHDEARAALRRLREVQPGYRVGSIKSLSSTDRMEAVAEALREVGLPE